MSDHKDLKAWCHWKRREKDLSEDDALFVKAIEDLVSQVGNYKAKLNDVHKERDAAFAMAEKNAYKLREATKAGTPYWAERDAQNSMILRINELEKERDELQQEFLAEHQAAVDMFSLRDEARDERDAARAEVDKLKEQAIEREKTNQQLTTALVQAEAELQTAQRERQDWKEMCASADLRTEAAYKIMGDKLEAKLAQSRAREAALVEALERVDRETKYGPMLTDGAVVQVRGALDKAFGSGGGG